MYEHNRDVTEEDLGIRAFHIKKAKAVERAIERLRHGMGPAWSDLTPEEIEELEWVFGELWAYLARAEWDDLGFGHLNTGDIIKILTLGSQMRRHARGSTDVLREVYGVINSRTSAPPPAAEEGLAE